MKGDNEMIEFGSVSAETRGVQQIGLEETLTGQRIFPAGIQAED